MPSDHVSDHRPARLRASRRFRLGGALALAGALAVTTVSAASARAGEPDGGRADRLAAGAAAAVALDGWDLILPVDAAGGTSGNHAAILRPAALRSPYLTREADGSLGFWAPSVGATTASSLHPRTELVGRDSWTVGNKKRTLGASVRVGQVPGSTHDVIVGQIHGAGDDSSVPLVMLHYDGGVIRVTVKEASDRSTVYKLVGGVPLDTAFSYTLSDNGNGTLTFTARVGTGSTVRKTVPVPSAYRGMQVRFAAGDYEQATEALPYGDGGRVILDRLTIG
ncbi:polysaccharide lyase family 7 protein [Kitasatospora sp. NPDC056138]|uniref:polysaccharide lyase family 7 protein n=1 Tax=Kitasatospora sp. NPDC056138 TaxID=3345724 RepID=UPI0035D9A47A